MRESLGRRLFAELLENALATAMGLFAIILMFGPVSDAHFNPVVSLVDVALGGLRCRHALAYIRAQIGGCILGAIVANAMLAQAVISVSSKHRATPVHLFAEVIATFTSSTSFANQAISIGRIFSNTFAGIAPTSVPG